jgi:hypothetical protein
MNHSFEVYQNKSMLFCSNDRWLHPLFAFEKFLKKSDINPVTLTVKDKIVGKAAAMVLVYLGIETIHAGTLSHLALSVLKERKVKYSYDLLVDRIDCQTENLLLRQDDPHEAYRMIKQRINQQSSMNS